LQHYNIQYRNHKEEVTGKVPTELAIGRQAA